MRRPIAAAAAVAFSPVTTISPPAGNGTARRPDPKELKVLVSVARHGGEGVSFQLSPPDIQSAAKRCMTVGWLAGEDLAAVSITATGTRKLDGVQEAATPFEQPRGPIRWKPTPATPVAAPSVAAPPVAAPPSAPQARAVPVASVKLK